MANGRGHAPDLTVFAFYQFHCDPARGNAFAKSNRRDARGQFRLRFQQTGLARERAVALNHNSALQLLQSCGGGNPFDLNPVFALMGIFGMEQFLIQLGFIA